MHLDYPPLDKGRQEFRLLRLHPRPRPTPETASSVPTSAPIGCDLFVASRDNAPNYRALSYVWGDANGRVTIQVNHCEHQITRNLRVALEHLREDHKSAILWIDAICINQKDYEEKNDQVLHMKEIYTSASCTIVWLGPSADSSDEFLERCGTIGGDLVKRQVSDGHLTWKFSDLAIERSVLPKDTAAQRERHEFLEESIKRELIPLIDEAQHNIPGTVAFVVASRRFLNRDYWKRVWIWQEFVVSPNIVLQSGYSKITFPELSTSLYFLFGMKSIVEGSLWKRQVDIFKNSPINVGDKIGQWLADGCPDNDYNSDKNEVLHNNDSNLNDYKNSKRALDALAESFPLMKMHGTRRAYQQPHKEDDPNRLSLIRMLAAAFVDGRAEATDARDRVFAMLGIAKDTRELGLVPNYDQSVTDVEVYTKTAQALIAAGNVDLLALAQHQAEPNKRENGRTNLPSWVPDWLHPITRPGGALPWDTRFAASGNTLFGKSPDFEAHPFSHLTLLGWSIDTIEQLAPPWIDADAFLSENQANTKKYLEDITELCDISNAKLSSTGHDIYAPGAGDRDTAYFLVPVADREMNSTGSENRASQSCQGAHAGLYKAVSSAIPEVSTELANYSVMMWHQRSRQPFLSTSGFVGLAPGMAEEGDVLVVFCGAKFPYFLRRDGEGMYKLVGEAYAHGIMYGEFMARAGGKEKFILR